MARACPAARGEASPDQHLIITISSWPTPEGVLVCNARRRHGRAHVGYNEFSVGFRIIDRYRGGGSLCSSSLEARYSMSSRVEAVMVP
jgi:hypothetical protein